jgi:hypothetical protein
MTFSRDLANKANDKSIVQIVNATYSTEVTSSTNTYVDTGLTATITPTSASNKILVIVSQSGVAKFTNNTWAAIRLVRGATTLIGIEANAGRTGNNNANVIGGVSCNYLDSPATTSATTYKTQFTSAQNLAEVYVQINSSTSTITLIEVVG